MARDTSKLVTIPGELHSAATGNIVSASQEIFDYDSNSYQSQLNKQVYNVSAHDSSATAKYTLDEAIAAVPTSYHVGGLILTFVSKEGDFEMYQLKSKEWTNDTEKWGIIKTAIVEDNPEFVEVHLDGSDKVLYGVQKDGNFYFGGGVPSQVKGYVDEKNHETDAKIDELARKVDSSISTAIEQIENDIDRLDASVNTGFARVDASMNQMESHFDSSINALDASIHNLGYYEENPEYAEVHLDASSKVLYGVQEDGNFYFGGGVPRQVKEYVDEKDAKIDASVLDIETRFYNVNEHDGSVGINYTLEEAIAAVPEAYRRGGLILTFNSNGSLEKYYLDKEYWTDDVSYWNHFDYSSDYINIPGYIDVKIDRSNHILEGTKEDGTKIIGGNLQVGGDVDTPNMNIKSIDNQEYIEVKTDNSGKILDGIYKDGSHYIHNVKSESIDELKNEVSKKVSKENGKGLSSNDYTDQEKEIVSLQELTDNPEYVDVKIDSSNHILESITKEGVKQINIPIETQAYNQYVIDNPEYIKVELDADDKIINAIKRNGDIIVGGVNINELKRTVDSNIIAIEYDASTYGIYAITGEDSNVSLSMDEEGHIYKETIIN